MSEEYKALLPLPRKFFERGLELKVQSISLTFSGGGDEGFWESEVSMQSDYVVTPAADQAVGQWGDEVTDWADETYGLSGDGDRSGATVEYNLVEKTMSFDSWVLEVAEDVLESGELEVSE